jgi:hypothetical protein
MAREVDPNSWERPPEAIRAALQRRPDYEVEQHVTCFVSNRHLVTNG